MSEVRANGHADAVVRHARVQASSLETSFPFDQLEPRIAEHLRGEKIGTCEDWRALGRRRFKIFGVVTRVAKDIDELVRATLSDAHR